MVKYLSLMWLGLALSSCDDLSFNPSKLYMIYMKCQTTSHWYIPVNGNKTFYTQTLFFEFDVINNKMFLFSNTKNKYLIYCPSDKCSIKSGDDKIIINYRIVDRDYQETFNRKSGEYSGYGDVDSFDDGKCERSDDMESRPNKF